MRYSFITLILALFLLHFEKLSAQVNPKCDIKQHEEPSRFEHWLHGKQNNVIQEAAKVYVIPVVVHVLHQGDSLGVGYNFPKERILNQIKTLNEDFRRKEGTPGFNTHPDGGDARIEFVLAQIDPNGRPTDGIVRINMKSLQIEPSNGDIITTCSKYSYWNPEEYLNIWCMETGLPSGLFLGSARFPVSDLEGLPKELPDGDGVFINATNFGSGEINSDSIYNMGRTLTHEVGHFLGLLHTFGSCGYTDYCNDTPPAASATSGCPSVKPMACDGSRVMTENYMDYSHDRCMNIFTNSQIARMRTVLENSPRRKSLLSSPALVVTDVASQNLSVKIYPNPVIDKLFIAFGDEMLGKNAQVSFHSLLGKVLFEGSFTATSNPMEFPMAGFHEKIFIAAIEVDKSNVRRLIRKE